MFPTSRIELSRSALRTNLRYIRRAIGAQVRLSSVIKSNAYGHGIEPFVPLAEQCGLGHFSVFSADEALRVTAVRTRPDTEIMVMGDIEPPAIEWAVEHGISFWVFDRQRLEAADQAAQRLGRPARVHLELETGLNRTGLDKAELAEALRRIRARPDRLRLEGLCTHFAGAESQANYLRIQQQIARFEDLTRAVRLPDGCAPLRHAACSAAAMCYPQTRLDLCRIGIMQYGFWPTTETRVTYTQALEGSNGIGRDPLRRVMRWSSRVMSIKDVPTGQNVGYGTSYLTTRPERLAAVPVGYGQGFARSLSNLGHVLLHGRRARVVGLVNMSMMLVDVTHISKACPGDEVVLIGKQGRAQISVSSFSDLSGKLNYEVLVRLPAEIPRVVVD